MGRMTDETTLLPCPFCGERDGVMIREHMNSLIGSAHFIAECECGATQHGYGKTERTAIKEAIRHWNRRYTEDDLK